jgi:hypothetical protein
MEDKIEELLHAITMEKNECTRMQHTRTLVIKILNLRIPGMEEGAEIQTKGIGNLFNKIIAENSPNLCYHVDTHVREAFLNSNRYYHIIS